MKYDAVSISDRQVPRAAVPIFQHIVDTLPVRQTKRLLYGKCSRAMIWGGVRIHVPAL